MCIHVSKLCLHRIHRLSSLILVGFFMFFLRLLVWATTKITHPPMSFPENISSTHLAFDSAAGNVTSNRFNRLHHAAVFLCHLLSVPKEKNNQVVKSNLTALTSAAASWRMVINGEARNPFDNDQYVHLRLKSSSMEIVLKPNPANCHVYIYMYIIMYV